MSSAQWWISLHYSRLPHFFIQSGSPLCYIIPHTLSSFSDRRVIRQSLETIVQASSSLLSIWSLTLPSPSNNSPETSWASPLPLCQETRGLSSSSPHLLVLSPLILTPRAVDSPLWFMPLFFTWNRQRQRRGPTHHPSSSASSFKRRSTPSNPSGSCSTTPLLPRMQRDETELESVASDIHLRVTEPDETSANLSSLEGERLVDEQQRVRGNASIHFCPKNTRLMGF